MRSTRVKVKEAEEAVPFRSRKIPAFLILWLAMAIPAHAKNHETGFLDRTITLQGTTYKYQVFVPETWTTHQKWPVILFLHGAGERGNDGIEQSDVGIGTEIRVDRERIPAIVVMPQCRKNMWWTQPPMDDLAMATLDAASKEFHGDPERTYLTGISMGGYGSWHLAEKYPRKFAAMIVICGGIRPPAATLKAHPDLAKWSPADDPKSYSAAAAKIGKTPVWIFHGADDDIVPITESRQMYAAMKEVGAEAHYTEYPNIKHVSWDKAYDDEKLFPWLFSKSLGSRSK